MSEELNIYKSISKCKRPNDDLVESECSRFKASGADFGIIELIDIKRYMTITPIIQIAFPKTEKEVKSIQQKWEERSENIVTAKSIKNPELAPSCPENILTLIDTIKSKVPDKYPGRLPTVSVLDPEGGFWTSTQARTVSSMQPIFCPTARFDLVPPELYYNLSKESVIDAVPSQDAASHAYYFAGMEFVTAILNIPLRAQQKDQVSLITDGDLILNDLQVSDFILGLILEENIWKNKEEPFSVAFGTTNTTIFARNSDQLKDLLLNGFFVRFEQ
jgi:hypothetical protein